MPACEACGDPGALAGSASRTSEPLRAVGPGIARLLIALLLGAATALAPAPATAQRQSREYRQAVRSALREFNAGRWEEARALFQQAHEASPSARTLRGIGMASFEMRDYAAAYRALMASLASDVRPLNRRQRGAAEELLGRSRAFLGRFMVIVRPGEAELSVDLRPAQLEADGYLLLGVGEHTLTATHEGYRPSESRILVEGLEDEEIRMELAELPPEPPESPEPVEADSSGTVSMVLMMTAAGLGVSAGLGAVWIVNRASEVSLCRDAGADCQNMGVLEGERTASVSFTIVMSAAAVAAAGVGLYVMFFGGDDDEEGPASEGAIVGCAPGPLGLSCSGRF